MNRRFLQPNSAAMVLAALSSVSPFVAGTVTAEQTDAGPPKLMNEVVVTGTRTPHALKDVPVETTVVSRQDIQQSNAQNVMDVLKTVPGIDRSRCMTTQTKATRPASAAAEPSFLSWM